MRPISHASVMTFAMSGSIWIRCGTIRSDWNFAHASTPGASVGGSSSESGRHATTIFPILSAS
jgi:hypothetical protein